MLMSYKVEKFKCVTSVMNSEPLFKEQPSKVVLFFQYPWLTSSSKPVLVPKGQAHLRTKVAFLGTASQSKEATDSGSVQNDCLLGPSDLTSPIRVKISTVYEEPGIKLVTVAW